MRISDWSSDVCSSDLSSTATAACAWRIAVSCCATRAACPATLASAAATCAFAASTATMKSRSSMAASRSEEHTSELQSLMRISYAVFCLKKKSNTTQHNMTDPNKHTHNTNTHCPDATRV